MMDPGFAILIAEDDENDAFIVKRALQEAGFENPVHICRDGAEVLRYLRAEDPYHDRTLYTFPRVLITDLKMPKMDGFELLEWLKQHPRCSIIPTIILSASSSESDVQRGYQLGANSYLVKPVSFAQLRDMLKLVLQYWAMCKIPEILPAKC